MKALLILILSLSSLSASVSYSATALNQAVEMDAFRVTYSDVSNTGSLFPIDCGHCEQSAYEFNNDTKIMRNGKIIKLDEFLNDYWNAKYPTIFVDFDNQIIERIAY